MPSYNLFQLQEQADAGWAHGRLYATGNANASASFRRGIDLSAGLNVQGEIGGEFGKGVAASLAAGARLTAGLSLTAAYPLDVFSEAGLVARLRAQAAAAAFLRAELSLDSEEFASLLRGRLSGPWVDLAEIFLTEIKISAGLWANAAVSVQLLAEAAIVGSFLRTPGAEPGFTCSFQYAAGYGYGAGINFRTNFGLANPPRLIDRLSNQFVLIIEREIQSVLPQLTEAERVAAQHALPLLRVVLPLVFRTIYEQGKALAGSSTEVESSASSSLLHGLIQEAQEALAGQVFELAISKLNDLLGQTAIGEAIRAMSNEDASRTVADLLRIRSRIIELSDLDSSSASWLQVILDLLDAFSALSNSLIAPSDRETWNDYLALGWSAAVIVTELVDWVNAPEGTERSLDLKAPAALPSSRAIPAHIASRVQKAPGVGLTVGDAVEFMLLVPLDQVDLLDSIRASVPQSALILDVLSSVVEATDGVSLLKILFHDFAELDGATLLLKMSTVLAPVIENQILPHLFTPLEQTADESVVELLNQIIKPTLLSMTRVILPQLGSTSTAEGAQKLREQISAVLLQSLSRLILVSTDIMADHVATEGPPVMRNLSQAVRDGTGGPAVGAALVLLSPAAGIPPEWTPTPEDLADILDICANTLEYWNEHERADWFRLAGDLISLGLMTGDPKLDAVWQNIKDSNSQAPLPALEDQLRALAERLAGGTWRLVLQIAPALLELFKNHFPRLVNEYVLKPLAAAASEAIKAIEQAAQWLNQQIEELRNQINRLVAQIQQAVLSIAARLQALAEYLSGQIETAVTQVREAGWNLVYSALFENDIFKLLRNEWEQVIIDGVRAVYNSAFDALKWLLDTPLQMFRAVAIWVQDVLRDQPGMADVNMIMANLRQRALSLAGMDMHLPIQFDVVVSVTIAKQKITVNLGRVDLGTVLFPHQSIVSTLIDTLMSDSSLRDAVTACLNEHNQNLSRANQINILRASLQNALTQEDASAGLENLTTGRDLEISIQELADDKTYDGSAPLRIILRGANSTFVTNVLGVPPRVKVLVNGQEHRYAAQSWTESGDCLVYAAKIVPSGGKLVPLPLLPPARYLELAVAPDVQLKAVIGSDKAPRLLAVPGTQPPPVRPVEIEPRGPGRFRPVERVVPPPHSEELLDAVVRGSRSITADPFTGAKRLPVSDDQVVTAVVVQKTDLFPITPNERMEGFRWTLPEDLLDSAPLEIPRETIIARPGLNRIDVIVVEGRERQPVSSARTFFLAEAS